MKYRILLTACLGFVLLLVAACGTSTPTPGGNTGKTPGSSASSKTTTNTVNVTITKNGIQSSRTTFYADRVYNFVVTNKDTSPHDFIIRTKPESVPLTPTTNQGILHIINSTHLPPNGTSSFTYQFPINTIQSNVEFLTHLTGPNGQSGKILPVQVRRS